MTDVNAGCRNLLMCKPCLATPAAGGVSGAVAFLEFLAATAMAGVVPAELSCRVARRHLNVVIVTVAAFRAVDMDTRFRPVFTCHAVLRHF
jgi:hypothetical protein